MKTRTVKKAGTTPSVKKGGNKTPAKAGASPAQSKPVDTDPAPVPILKEDVTVETSQSGSNPKPVEGKTESVTECNVGPNSSTKVNGGSADDRSDAVKKPNEPAEASAKLKTKAVNPKKRILSPNKVTPSSSQVGSSASQLVQSASETIANRDKSTPEKPEAGKGTQSSSENRPMEETTAAVIKGRGTKKIVSKGKGTSEAVNMVSEQDKQSMEELGNELPSTVLKQEQCVEVNVPSVVGHDTEMVEKHGLDVEVEINNDNQEFEIDEDMIEEEDYEQEVEEEGEGNGEEHQADALPSRPVTESQKRRKLEVFVGGIDKDATKDDLKAVFQRVGDVVEVRLMMNPLTGKNKGYAFIRFGNAEQAARATTELARTQVRGKECGVLPNQDNDTLFIGNISRHWKSAQVLEKLKEYRIDGIEEMTLMEDPHNEGLNRGFAFLELATHKDAVNAFQRLQQPDVIFGSDRSAKVAWAEPFNDPDDAVMSQVKSVFVDGMPTNWNDDKVKQHFGKFGEIERIVFARDMPVAKRKDFAFVNFVARESALACVEAFEGLDLLDGDNKVKVKVKLSRPLPKGRSGKGIARGGFLFEQGRRGEGWFHGPNFGLRNSARGGRGLVRGRGRGRGTVGRGGKRLYDEEDVRMLVRALREEENWSRERRPSGSRFPGMSRGFPRGSYPESEGKRHYDARRDEPRRNDIGFSRGAYHRSGSDRGSPRGRSNRPDVTRDEYGPHVPRRGGPSARSRPFHSGRPYSPRHAAVHPHRFEHRYEQGHIYGDDGGVFGSRDYDYDESGLGMKRSVSMRDDDPSYYDPGHRGYPRARVDYANPAHIPENGSQYAGSMRSPPGPPSQVLGLRAGRTGLSSVGGGPISSLHNSGSGLGNPGSSSIYGNHDYGSLLPETNDYISGAPEVRGTSLHPSSLYAGHAGPEGYEFQGAGYY